MLTIAARNEMWPPLQRRAARAMDAIPSPVQMTELTRAASCSGNTSLASSTSGAFSQ